MYTYIHISPPSCVSLPPSLSHPSRWSQSTQLMSLCYAAASHQLSILHLVVYICPCYSLISSQLTLPPPSVQNGLFGPHVSPSCVHSVFILCSFCVHPVFVQFQSNKPFHSYELKNKIASIRRICKLSFQSSRKMRISM